MKKLKIFSLVLMIITIAGICLTGCGKAKVPEPTGETSEEVQTDETRQEQVPVVRASGEVNLKMK